MNSQARLVLPWQPRSSWDDEVHDEGDDAGYDEVSEVVVVAPQAFIPGDPLRSTMAGAAMGALAGILALVTAAALVDRGRLVELVRIAFGQASASTGETLQAVWIRVGLAACAGMLAGAGLGWLTRRLHSRAARVVFALVLVPSLWIVIDAFVLARFAPGLAAAAPFLPCLAGALAYGACFGMARPSVPRWAR
jgi:hypothetical protein